ncbi:cell division protein ZapE [Anaplasmataceae bacterium AB001_6]|nr:cell division protein ZapE [Anaplasmataceae bacterium AB001_6]
MHVKKKVRFHYHRFISDLHSYINSNHVTVREYVHVCFRDIKLICIDELHINDVVDAMCLKDFIISANNMNIVIFFTSNYLPDKLYTREINSECFFPAVEYINKYFDIVELTEKRDYRIPKFGNSSSFYCSINRVNPITLLRNSGFELKSVTDDEIESLGIKINFKVLNRNIAILDFDYLCASNFGRDLYFALTEKYKIIFLSDLYQIKDRNILRRLIIFIDQCYENQVKIIITSTIEIDKISKLKERDIKRSLSRIRELTNITILDLE